MVDAAHARELIARSIARHGGERWSRIERLTLRPRPLSGLVPWVKGNGRTFGLPSHAELEPQIARATFFDYPRAGERGVFEAGRVALGDAPLAERRGRYRGFGKLRRWQPLDALYFFGYALTHYHAMPWTLRDAEPLALRRTGRRPAARRCRLRAEGPVSPVVAHALPRADRLLRSRRPHRSARLRRRHRRQPGARRPLLARLRDRRGDPHRDAAGPSTRASVRQPLPIVALDAHFDPPSVTLAPGPTI